MGSSGRKGRWPIIWTTGSSGYIGSQPNGIILWANRADYEPLGYTHEEWVGHHAAEFHADHAALADISQHLAKGETIYNYPARLRHKNGSVQNVLILTSVLFDDAGNFVHTRCFTVLAPASSGD